MNKKFIYIIIALLATLLVLSGCGKTSKDTEKDSQGANSGNDGISDGKRMENAEKVSVSELKDLENYVIVRGDTATDAIKATVKLLRTSIEEKTGVSLKVNTDWSQSGGRSRSTKSLSAQPSATRHSQRRNC